MAQVCEVNTSSLIVSHIISTINRRTFDLLIPNEASKEPHLYLNIYIIMPIII
jgi:hypothetical protein